MLSFTELVVHPDGTIFTFLETKDGDGNWSSWIVGIDSTTGALKFSVPMPHAENSYGIIIAGDGYAYAPYATRDISNSGEGDNWSCSQFNHFRVLRIDTSGSYADIDVMDFPSRCTGDLPPPFEGIGMITNADQGVLLTWSTRDGSPDSGASYMATITGTGVSVTEQPVGTGIIDPVLQAQDGSYIGMVYTGPNALNLVAFDASGNVRWMVPGNWQPQIATADGGVIATDQDTGAAVTFDQSGNATGALSFLPILSWTGTAYEGPATQQVQVNPIPVATTLWALLGGNLSGNSTAAKEGLTLQGPTCAKTTFDGGPLVNCKGDLVVPFFYGYQECASYEVYKVSSKQRPPQQIKRKGIAFDEEVTIGIHNIDTTPTTSPGATDKSGILLDDLVLGGTTRPLNLGSFTVDRQIIKLHSTGTTVRVNCLDFEVADVTVTDITSAPDTICTRNQ
jgi:hypothetical protein